MRTRITCEVMLTIIKAKFTFGSKKIKKIKILSVTITINTNAYEKYCQHVNTSTTDLNY